MTIREAKRVLRRVLRADPEVLEGTDLRAISTVLLALSSPTKLERGAAPLIDFLADYNGWVPVEKRRACEAWLKSYRKKVKR